MRSGGHLATALPFRLKRYGLTTPKGVVAIVPTINDRSSDALGNRVYVDGHSAITNSQMTSEWMNYNFGNMLVGPEAYANHATVAECVGYPSCFIHTAEFDPCKDGCREFYSKLLEAKTFAEIHNWGGAHHASGEFDGSFMFGEESPYSAVVNTVIFKNMEDCFTYDLRRPWVVDELKKNGPWW